MTICDTVLDPFAGTGSTTIAAIAAGRNSIGNEVERSYIKIAYQRVRTEVSRERLYGATKALLVR